VNRVAVYIISDGIGGAEQVVWQTINGLKDQPGIFLIVNNEIADYYDAVLNAQNILNIGSIYPHLNPSFRFIRYLLNNRFYSIKPLLVKSKTKIINRFLRRNEISTVHAHMEFALLSALNIKRKFNSIKVIYTVHSAFGFLGDKSLKPQHRISNNEYSNVDIFVFVSKYNLQVFRMNNVPVKKYIIIYNSINLSTLQNNINHKAVTDHFQILYVGGAKYVKGYDLLVETVKKLIHDFGFSNLRITILGHIPSDCELNDLIKKSGLSTYFNLIGFVHPPDHYKYFQQADLLFMPSRSEAMPMAAVEALFFNLPIVASNVGGLSEIISNRNNGYLCPPDPAEFAEAIFRSFNEYTQLHQSTKSYNESVGQAFDSEIVMKQVRNLYFNLNEMKNNGW
jgi:glycosyltransferase involved in cell wall biosynthesis